MSATKATPVPEEQVSATERVEDKDVSVPVKKTAAKRTTTPKTDEPAEEKPVVKKTTKNAESEAEEAPVKKTTARKSAAAEETGPEAKKPTVKRAAKKTVAEDEEAPVKKTASKAKKTEEEAAETLVAEEAAPTEEAAEPAAEETAPDTASPSPTEDTVAEAEAADYSNKAKAELIATLEELLADKPVQTIRRDAEAVKVAFYKLYRAETDLLRRAFLEDGGDPEQFTPPVDEEEQRFKALFADYRDRRNQYMATLDDEKEENYKTKLRIIDELKELIDSGETLGATFNAFRELQRRWKETGPVPQTHLKDLWETYNLHVENFYNYIKINKELRDLDLKKNYEAKLQLCEEAEALLLEASVINAFHKLQKLHEQWRETGPVANEYKEQLWERFREASSKINKRHQEHFESLKDEQKRNLELKAELCAKTEELADAPYVSRKEWNKASEQLQEIQRIWKTIGFAPKKDNTKIYERFRAACDRFFENKRGFYSEAKQDMENNLALKNEICAEAEALKESDDWKKTTDELIALQRRWKETGPVSRRHADAVWKRFRAACDAFFERKQAHFSTVDNQYEQNLSAKHALIEELKTFTFETRDQGFEAIKELQRRWSEVGFVPIKQKDAIQAEYRKLVDAVFAKLRGNEREHRMERFKSRVSNLSEGGKDRQIRSERERLYAKMKQLESDIALLENNIGFFSKSKNAETMIRDVNAKIDKYKEEMATIVEKINMIDKQNNA